MREYLKKLPPEIKDLIAEIGKVSQEAKMPAYLVGGFVRDLILGVKKNPAWDPSLFLQFV